MSKQACQGHRWHYLTVGGAPLSRAAAWADLEAEGLYTMQDFIIAACKRANQREQIRAGLATGAAQAEREIMEIRRAEHLRPPMREPAPQMRHRLELTWKLP